MSKIMHLQWLKMLDKFTQIYEKNKIFTQNIE
jgi:hypothetical protein